MRPAPRVVYGVPLWQLSETKVARDSDYRRRDLSLASQDPPSTTSQRHGAQVSDS